MPDSDTAGPFWRALMTCGALLLAMGLLNTAIDPTGELGLAGTHALNRNIPAPVVSFVRMNDRVSAYKRTIATTSAHTFLIGTSREARGFDLCDRAHMLRIAGSGWGIRNLAQVHTMILETRKAPATLLIELGIASDPGGAGEEPNVPAAYTALLPRTTLLSLQTIAANVSGPADPADRASTCRSLPSEPQNWAAAAESFQYQSRATAVSPTSRRNGEAILKGMIQTADRICASTGIRHTIVFFSLPGTPNAPLTRQFDLALQDAQQAPERMFRALPDHTACRFRYLNLIAALPGSSQQQQLWRKRDLWLDYTHFSPTLGRLALDAILERAD